MNWVDILVIIILVLSFLGGLKEGAVKQFFILLATVIAIPLAGLSYRPITSLLSFLPGTNWENFIGFFITLAVFTLILQLAFLIPRKIIQKLWKKGVITRTLGGIFGLLNAIIGFVVFPLVLYSFPIISWITDNVANSAILPALVNGFGFVQSMLPALFHRAAPVVFTLD
ncbi:MAG: CvpA family protein [Chloroflexota bacterium]